MKKKSEFETFLDKHRARMVVTPFDKALRFTFNAGRRLERRKKKGAK
jgi:hypothetical protein